MDEYEELEKVGEGTYGKVYKAKEKNTGNLVALKKIKIECSEEGIPSTTIREVSLLQMLSHNIHIVRLLDVKYYEGKNGKQLLYLVFEYMDCDLKKFMADYSINKMKMNPTMIKSFLYQICKGVAYCNSHGIIHRDLKSRNLLVNKEKGLIKIADLGLARAFTVPMKQYTHEIMTLHYRAPEVLLGTTHYSTAVDIWSVGCIFAEMYLMQPLFPGDSEVSQLLHIFRHLGTPNEDIWPGVTKMKDWHAFPEWTPQNLNRIFPYIEPSGVDLLSKMLMYDPLKRISAKKALEHPYFNEIDKTSFSYLN